MPRSHHCGIQIHATSFAAHQITAIPVNSFALAINPMTADQPSEKGCGLDAAAILVAILATALLEFRRINPLEPQPPLIQRQAVAVHDPHRAGYIRTGQMLHARGNKRRARKDQNSQTDVEEFAPAWATQTGWSFSESHLAK